MICFIWDNPAPQDGDSFASRILTTGGAEVVDLGAKFTSPVVVPAEGGADVVVGGTVKSVADGLATLALEVTSEGQKGLGMPKAVVRVAGA